jgi:hypothetical protein
MKIINQHLKQTISNIVGDSIERIEYNIIPGSPLSAISFSKEYKFRIDDDGEIEILSCNNPLQSLKNSCTRKSRIYRGD